MVFLQAWNTWVHCATFHLPPEPNGFYNYNALQQIAYFTVVFVFVPLAILTGIAMSPAVNEVTVQLIVARGNFTGFRLSRHDQRARPFCGRSGDPERTCPRLSRRALVTPDPRSRGVRTRALHKCLRRSCISTSLLPFRAARLL